MSTPHQPGSDKQNNGSASSTPPQQAPAQGNGAPAPQQGNRPGPPPKPQQGPAQQGPAQQGPAQQGPAQQGSAGNSGSSGNANPKGQSAQGGRPAPPTPPTTAPDRGRAPAARPQGSPDGANQRPGQVPPPGNRAPAPGGRPPAPAGQPPAPGSQAPASGKPPAGAETKPAQQSPPPRPAAGAPADTGKPKPDAPTEAAPAASVQGAQGKPSSDRGTPQPPWQRGVQREPQTNLKRPGQPGAGQPAAPQQKGPAAPAAKGPATAPAKPVVTGTAAPGAREAAKAKSEAIDGPTRHISRKSLPADMPDLSEAKHPTPAAAPAAAKTAVAVAPQRIAEGEPLRAAVQLRRIDPWSMLKISSVISVSLFFVWMVAVGLLYVVLDGMGVWERLNNAFTDIVADGGTEGLVTAGQVFGYSAVIGLINMVLFTALVTIGSFIYNLCADLVGGLEITLADRD